MSPRLSVILTVYKRTAYLAQALDSVLAQSYGDYEVIVADDSGTAASRPIVMARGPAERIHYMANPTTLGVVASLVRAVQSARGEYVAILNDDDFWAPDLLRELVTPLAADSRRVLAFSDHWVVDRDGRVDQSLSERWSQCFGRAALAGGVVSSAAEFTVATKGVPLAVAALFRRDAIDWALVVPQVAGAYDYWLACQLAATRRPLFYVPKRLAWYRVHPEMETCRRGSDKVDSMVYVYSVLRDRGWFQELDAWLKSELAEALLAAGREKLRCDLPREARRDLWRSFCLRPRGGILARAVATLLPRRLRLELAAGLRAGRRWTGLGSGAGRDNPLRSESFDPS